MQSWTEALKRGLISGTTASLASTFVLALLGHRRTGSVTAPTNATSHWFWGDGAAQVDGMDARHTLLGYLTHHASAVMWAVLYERYRSAHSPQLRTLRNAATMAAVAYFVDYRLTPKRLTPGFEHRLPKRDLTWVYGSFALGLAATSITRDRAGRASVQRRQLAP